MSVLARIIAIASKARLIDTLTINTNPVPASRPRVGRWGTFYLKPYAEWMECAKKHVSVGSLNLSADNPLLVVVEHIVERPRTTKKLWPRGDCDNYVKGPLDIVTKASGWWADDEQITLLLTCKRFALLGEAPRTEMEIYHAA